MVDDAAETPVGFEFRVVCVVVVDCEDVYHDFEGSLINEGVAERAGFEPAVPLPVHSISNAAQSAALSPLLVKREED